MTDHELTTQLSDGRYSGVDPGCVRIVCACGWQGVWMFPEIEDASGTFRPTVDYAEVLIEQLRPMHPSPNDPDPEEELYQKLLGRLRAEGHVADRT